MGLGGSFVETEQLGQAHALVGCTNEAFCEVGRWVTVTAGEVDEIRELRPCLHTNPLGFFAAETVQKLSCV